MKIYLVWEGYEDVAKIFIHKENAVAYVKQELKENPNPYKMMLSICEEETADENHPHP